MSTVLNIKNSRAQNISFKKTMFYITGILLFLFIIFFCLYNALKEDWILTLLITFGVSLYHFAVRLVIGYATDKLFRGKINKDSRWFSQRNFEQSLYKFLKVHKWKKYMPTFDPEQFDTKAHSLDKIADSMCTAEICHEIIMIFSMLPIFLIIPFGSPAVFLITSVISAAIDFSFVIMQRYNRPRIIRILKRTL